MPPTWRPDYLTFRIAPSPIRQTRDVSRIIHADLAVEHGNILFRHTRQSVGMLANSYGALAVHLKGEYWHALAMQDRLNIVPEHLEAFAKELCPAATTRSIARIDYCTDIPFTSEADHHALARRAFTAWPWPTRPPTGQERRSSSGTTYYVGIAGNDPDRLRERETLLRIYTHHLKRPGALRIELECKQLQGSSPLQQLQDAQLRTSQLATALNLPTDLHSIHVDEYDSRRRATLHECYARIAGMTYGAFKREHPTSHYLPQLLTLQLRELGHSLGLTDAERDTLLTKAIRKHYPNHLQKEPK